MITRSETIKITLLILHIRHHCWNILHIQILHLFRQNVPETRSLGNWVKNERQWFWSEQVPTWSTRSSKVTVRNWKPMVRPMRWYKRLETNSVPTWTKGFNMNANGCMSYVYWKHSICLPSVLHPEINDFIFTMSKSGWKPNINAKDIIS